MNTGVSLTIALVVAAHVLIILRVVFNHRKNEICIVDTNLTYLKSENMSVPLAESYI